MLLDLCAVVPAGVVNQESGGFLPRGRLPVQLLSEVLQVRDHDIAIRVGLIQGAPDPTLSIEGSNYGKSWRDLLFGESELGVGGRPQPSKETRRAVTCPEPVNTESIIVKVVEESASSTINEQNVVRTCP